MGAPLPVRDSAASVKCRLQCNRGHITEGDLKPDGTFYPTWCEYQMRIGGMTKIGCNGFQQYRTKDPDTHLTCARDVVLLEDELKGT